MRRAVLLALLLVAGCRTAEPPPDTRRSGTEFMSPATQAMQRDDTLNPAMLWVKEGEALWTAPAGASGRSCAACHGEAARSMRGVAARYPALDRASGEAMNLGQRIAQCRAQRQHAAPPAPDSDALIALETYVALQSRGMPIVADPALAAWRERGRVRYAQRIGQLDLSCAQCHDDHAGRRLAGNPIPQAHPTGYPIYRLEWQGMGTLQRRLRNCMSGVRAEPFAYGAKELVELEAYLAGRAAGMAMETPAVRP